MRLQASFSRPSCAQELTPNARMESQFKSTSWLELVSRRNIVRVHVAVFSHIWAQYSGTNALMYYIVYIFQMAGLTGTEQSHHFEHPICYQCHHDGARSALRRQVPRRYVMMGGSLLMATWLFTTGGIMATNGHAVPGGLNGNPTVTWVVDSGSASIAAIACSYLFIATSACTWGECSVSFLSPAPPMPRLDQCNGRLTAMQHLQSGWDGSTLRKSSLCTSDPRQFRWRPSLTGPAISASTFFTPPAFQNIQWRFYLIFGSFCLAASVHVFLFFQESRGKSLEEMNDIFDNNTFAYGKIVATASFSERVEQVREELERKARIRQQLSMKWQRIPAGRVSRYVVSLLGSGCKAAPDQRSDA